MTIIRTIELFAGVGGFRLGLERAEAKNGHYEIVWSNQWEPGTTKQHASEVYVQRFGSKNHSNDDIATVKTADIPDHDCLVGGFPCQDYSVARTLKNASGIEGKKGVLWWEIHRILMDKSPDYLILENVDRLINSPSTQRGRDFAIILCCLNHLGYAAEWRVINGGDYGYPQKRRRTFIVAYKVNGKLFNNVRGKEFTYVIGKSGVLANAFPIKKLNERNYKLEGLTIDVAELSQHLLDITQTFNLSNQKNMFLNSGYMYDGLYKTIKTVPSYNGPVTLLSDVLQDEEDVDDEFYIDEDNLDKWRFCKGAKALKRVDKETGHEYEYKEGGIPFPDNLDSPSRTIITSEGGATPARHKHVVEIDGKFRRLTPIEMERLNGFPDNHTEGKSSITRAFLMGNALIVGIIERIGATMIKLIGD